MALYFKDIEITNIDNLVPQTGLGVTDMWFGSTNVYTVWETYEGALPTTLNANGDNLRQYQVWGNTGGVGDDSGTAYGYEVDISISDGTNATTTPIYIGSDPLDKDEYVDYAAQKVYRRTDNLFNIDDLWDKGTSVGGDEASIFLEIPVENGIYTAGTNVPNNSNPDIASVFVAQAVITAPPSSTNGVFIDRPRTITTTTGKLYIGIRVHSATGYQTFTKETFAPYYINAVSGSLVPTTAIPYLQPIDPPAPLPALPTCEGTTIVDYAGSGTAPDKVLLNYRKEEY